MFFSYAVSAYVIETRSDECRHFDVIATAEDFARRNPDAVAVIDPAGRQWSRGEVEALTGRLARALVDSGIGEGETLAIVAPNCAEYLVVYLAAIRAGLYVVPVNWHFAPREIAYVLGDCRARVVVVHAGLGSKLLGTVAHVRPAQCRALSIGDVVGFVSLAAFVRGIRAIPVTGRRPGRVMPYTSATTGRPKGVRLPRRNAENALQRIVAWHRSLGIAPEDDNVHLVASTLYHSAPLEGAIIALHMGHRVVLVGRWRAAGMLELIQRHRVTTAFMVPTMFIRLLKLPPAERSRYETTSLRFVVHGGAPCPLQVKRSMIEWWGPIVWESYGAAEGQGCIVSSEEWLSRPGTVGRPIAGSAVKILDESGRTCAPGEAGRVYLKPHTGDLFEYRGDAELTRASRRGDFITVGDRGYADADGYLYLCDREADLILTSGTNIYPAEIEMALVQHAAVKDCAVVGIADELLGQVPQAFVEVQDGELAGQALAAELTDFLAEHLAAMKLPRRVQFVAAIPRDPSGKLYRRALGDSRRNCPQAQD